MKTLLLFITSIAFLSLILFIDDRGLKLYKIKTSSMEPKLKTGDLIVILNSKSYKTGDIISYKTLQSQYPTTHRITSIFKSQGKVFLLTKGDNNDANDPYPISEEEVIGKFVFLIPFGTLTKDCGIYRYFILFVCIVAGFIIGKVSRKYLP